MMPMTLTDDQAVAARVEAEGKDPWAPPKILSLTDIEKLLGKKKFAKILSDLVARQSGKPSLAPTSAKNKKAFLSDKVFDEIFA